jgi:hypothetical protein
MTELGNDTIAVLATLVALLLLAFAVAALQRRHRTQRLRRRFGSEYERAVRDLGDRNKAEAELRERERRVENIRPLARADAARFAAEWKRLQGRFVDDPRRSLTEADLLVRELMTARGYPMGDFERRAADVSVDHPAVVGHYRAAHAVAQREEGDAIDTEDLRQAVVHYRALFSELLEVAAPRRWTRHASQVRYMETR